MDDFLMLPILNELQDEENGAFDEQTRRKGNPLIELSDRQFVRLFRLTKELFHFIVEILTPFLRPPRRDESLDIPTRILATLRFYAGGSYQHDVGCNWFVGISQSSVSRSITEVTQAFNEPEVFNRFVKFPRNLQELEHIRQRFSEKFDFPGVIGCIDCTHVAIFPPMINNEEMPEYLFVNRKNYHSINVQLICDENLKVLDVVARYPGSTHDAYIWRNSPINDILQDIHRRGYTDYFLLGDSGYPLRSWLLTPMEQEPAIDTPAYRYNIAHKRVRSIVERCNGVLKGRFRCCMKHRVLHYAPDVACKIINACVILHNICIDHNIPESEDELGEDVDVLLDENAGLNIVGPQGNPDLVAGQNARARVINARFQQ